MRWPPKSQQGYAEANRATLDPHFAASFRITQGGQRKLNHLRHLRGTRAKLRSRVADRQAGNDVKIADEDVERRELAQRSKSDARHAKLLFQFTPCDVSVIRPLRVNRQASSPDRHVR